MPYVVAKIRSPNSFQIPAVLFEQPKNCTKKDLTREMKIKAKAMFVENHPTLFTPKSTFKNLLLFEVYNSKDVAEENINHYNRTL